MSSLQTNLIILDAMITAEKNGRRTIKEQVNIKNSKVNALEHIDSKGKPFSIEVITDELIGKDDAVMILAADDKVS